MAASLVSLAAETYADLSAARLLFRIVMLVKGRSMAIAASEPFEIPYDTVRHNIMESDWSSPAAFLSSSSVNANTCTIDYFLYFFACNAYTFRQI